MRNIKKGSFALRNYWPFRPFGIEKEYIPARDGEYVITLANYSKANQVLGWQPKLDLEDYIRMIVE